MAIFVASNYNIPWGMPPNIPSGSSLWRFISCQLQTHVNTRYAPDKDLDSTQVLINRRRWWFENCWQKTWFNSVIKKIIAFFSWQAATKIMPRKKKVFAFEDVCQTHWMKLDTNLAQCICQSSTVILKTKTVAVLLMHTQPLINGIHLNARSS